MPNDLNQLILVFKQKVGCQLLVLIASHEGLEASIPVKPQLLKPANGLHLLSCQFDLHWGTHGTCISACRSETLSPQACCAHQTQLMSHLAVRRNNSCTCICTQPFGSKPCSVEGHALRLPKGSLQPQAM